MSDQLLNPGSGVRAKAPGKPVRLLLAEDSDDDALLLLRLIRENGYEPDCVHVADRTACAQALDTGHFDLIITDYAMPGFTAVDVIQMARERGLEVPLIVVSGTIGEDVAVDTMRMGASDYVMKGKWGRLVPAIKRELEEGANRAARRIAEKQNRLLIAAIEQAAEGVVITDTQGIIEYANPAFERITGYSREEALGKRSSILKSGKHDPAFYATLWRTINAGSVWRGHFKNKRKDGSIYEEESVISPVRDGSGKIVNHVAVKRDVTRDLELERQLRESQKLQAVGQFAHKVVHDFTNSLAVISSHTESARDELPAASAAYGHLDCSLKAIQRIAAFVAELMAFAHPSPPRTTTIALARIIDGIEEILRRTTAPAIRLDLDIQDAEVKVLADISQIEQAIVNVVANAVEAMPKGGTLTIQVSSTRLPPEVAVSGDCPPDGDCQIKRWGVLTIMDTGFGMTEDVLAHAFEPFFSTKKQRNVGLGLPLVFKIVELHHGQVTLRSQPGQGTTVQILLPAVVSSAGSGRVDFSL